MILGVQGANRVHGGGFAGTIQAFVPNDIVTLYKTEMEKVFGASLKKEYDPQGEDKLTERVVLMVENGQI